MNAMTMRQKFVLAAVAFFVAYALAVVLWLTSVESSWTKARRSYRSAVSRYETECQLIAERDHWVETYEINRQQMPAAGEDADVKWRPIFSELAKTNHLAITSKGVGKAVDIGDGVTQFSIDMGWCGSLQSLVDFMYAIEHSRQGMFDIDSLIFSPDKSRPGYLKGSFTLTCAYMKED